MTGSPTALVLEHLDSCGGGSFWPTGDDELARLGVDPLLVVMVSMRWRSCPSGIADDQLALCGRWARRVHGLEPRLLSLHGLVNDDANLDLDALLVTPRFAIDGLAEAVHDAAEHTAADGTSTWRHAWVLGRMWRSVSAGRVENNASTTVRRGRRVGFGRVGGST